ncbi:hypothetical protein V6U90_25435 [Micromonospora sp. CPCC 206060]|uniref:hypothetical protein n=1 Tax=Micromonospora sp. CPCC 206060 TaxID=3122406 RepID=UPI002FF42152
MEAIPLLDGDLRWVFPGLTETDEMLDLVRRADGEFRLLADHLGARPGWTGSGIEFHRLEWGQASLSGCVESGEVSFVAQLWYPRRCGTDLRSGPPWAVDGEITVRCDARVDCGPHYIEETTRELDVPLAAARELLRVATWLRERGTTELRHSWRQRDPRSGHD